MKKKTSWIVVHQLADGQSQRWDCDTLEEADAVMRHLCSFDDMPEPHPIIDPPIPVTIQRGRYVSHRVWCNRGQHDLWFLVRRKEVKKRLH